MKITCLGGGPAGLYFALLMKKASPRHEITVYERNAPNDTFGWGVVFSDETLGNLEESDQETYRAITRAFARWTAIDIFYKGAHLRSGGHGFCGISRKRFLNILQERCAELGVRVEFKTEIADVNALRRETDLLVASDGVNSLTRRVYERELGPSLDVRKCRYVWLGTHRRFDAFTFSFHETEHGIFQVHAYQFDADTGTFIVECTDETWERAGLDRAPEAEGLRYLERVFERELEGQRLMPNLYRWIQFTTVRNERWSHDNVVLIGDAAHTAHFSIGSGTKLAMEDSIALAAAFRAHEGDTRAALEAYEAERRPVVERTQRAAQESLEWFENVRRYWHFEPPQFAFSLLTRSRKIGYDNLKLRDPDFGGEIDRWFDGHVGIETVAGAAPVPAMFTPFELRDLELINRVVCSPMCMYSAEDGTPNDFHLVHLGSRAIGGAGLVFAEMTDIARDARISPGCAGMYKEEHVIAWRRIVDFVHAHSPAKIGLQLGHAGRKGSTKRMWEGIDEPLPEGNWPLVGPSPIAYADINQIPREMTEEDMARVREQFVRAAVMAERAGFDILELHFAHGYLVSSFITPVSNRRTDAYGGSLENRMRFPLEVFDAVRQAWPIEKPISVRVSATDWVHNGLSMSDSVDVARMLKEHGCDIVAVSTGQTTPEAKPVYGRCYQAPFSDRIRNEAGIPTMTVGNITTPDEINSILLAGRADLCVLARTHLRDPYFTLHAAEQYGYLEQPLPPQYSPVRVRPPRKPR